MRTNRRTAGVASGGATTLGAYRRSAAIALLAGTSAIACSAFVNQPNDATGEESGITGAGTGVAGEVTIYEIQQGDVPEDSTVTVRGAVVTTPYQEVEGAVFVEDPQGGEWSGIYVFFQGSAGQGVVLQPGDVIDFTGLYSEFFGASEITIFAGVDVQIVGTAPVPDPVLADPAEVVAGDRAESLEGVLVRVEDVECTEPDPGFGEFVMTGGLHADDFFVEIRPAMGDHFDAINGTVHYSFEQFKLYPRSMADFEGWAGDGDGDGDMPVDSTIYEIQQGMLAEGTRARVTGAVVTSPLDFAGETFWVQDPAGGPFSGLAVFAPSALMLTITPGDEVTVVGEYREYFGLSELAIQTTADLAITGTAASPTPVVLDPADIATGGSLAEDYESVLVRVDGVTVVDDTLGFGEFSISGGLRVDDQFFDPTGWTVPAVNDTFSSITGPLTFGFDEFKLLPRTAADLVP
jgi:predicted extracellular nuclease